MNKCKKCRFYSQKECLDRYTGKLRCKHTINAISWAKEALKRKGAM